MVVVAYMGTEFFSSESLGGNTKRVYGTSLILLKENAESV